MKRLLAVVFAALAHPTRRAMLARLALREASVTELARPFPISLPAVSRQSCSAFSDASVWTSMSPRTSFPVARSSGGMPAVSSSASMASGVIAPFDAPRGMPPYVGGATILADGAPALVGVVGPLQLDVLNQVTKPKLIACDTMNFWIQSRRADILRLLGHVDIMTLNDAEARQLTEKVNLVQAAQWIMARGPRHVIIKKGEHGALLFTGPTVFSAPAYPLEDVFDPTGAGDTFAGGFYGWIAKQGKADEPTLRQAVLYGSALASFCVEKFGPERLKDLTLREIEARVREFHDLARVV